MPKLPNRIAIRFLRLLFKSNLTTRRWNGCFRCTCTKKRNGLCSTMVRAAVYSTDGRFLYAIWRGRTRCLRDIELSHVFFLPFNVVKILKIFGDLNSCDMDPLQRTLGLHQPFCWPSTCIAAWSKEWITAYILTWLGKSPYCSNSSICQWTLASVVQWCGLAMLSSVYYASTAINDK